MIDLTDKPIDLRSIHEKLSARDSGSIVLHAAVVKASVEDGRSRGIRFAPDGDMKGELENLENSLREKWAVNDLLLVRRVGELGIGDVISVVAASAPGRETAFGVCMDAVEGFKKMKRVRKTELLED